MHILFLFLILLPVILLTRLVRAVTRPYRYHRWGSTWNNPGAGWNRYGYGNGWGGRYGRRRGGFAGPGLFSLLALFALERFIDGNRR